MTSIRRNLCVVGFVVLGLAISACATPSKATGPATAILLAQAAPEKGLSPSWIDQDLTRYLVEADGENIFGFGATPLSGAVIDALVKAESAKLGLAAEKQQRLASLLKAKFAGQRVCFDTFLRAGAGAETSKLQYYALTVQSLGKSVDAGIEPASRELLVLDDLLRAYFPISTEGWPRDVRGIGSYSREVVCAPVVELNKPFSLTAKFRPSPSATPKVLSWDPGGGPPSQS